MELDSFGAMDIRKSLVGIACRANLALGKSRSFYLREK